MLKFQFHFGTIDSVRNPEIIQKRWEFQFHFGTIDSVRLYRTECIDLVSIPLWYDW